MISDNVTHKNRVNICAISYNGPDILLNQMRVLRTQGYQRLRKEYSTSREMITGGWECLQPHLLIQNGTQDLRFSHSSVAEDSSLLQGVAVSLG
jgi:hypothetical protein